VYNSNYIPTTLGGGDAKLNINYIWGYENTEGEYHWCRSPDLLSTNLMRYAYT
jgi:hypothetical protein